MKYIKNFRELSLLEVRTEVYNILKVAGSKMKIVMSPRSIKGEFKYSPKPQEDEPLLKPNGLYYSYGTTWIDWVKDNEPDWEGDDVYYLDTNDSKILKLNTLEDIVEFGQTYGVKYEGRKNILRINWKEVSKKWSGIEIGQLVDDHFSTISLYREPWYEAWGVGQGCIWGEGVVRALSKF